MTTTTTTCLTTDKLTSSTSHQELSISTSPYAAMGFGHIKFAQFGPYVSGEDTRLTQPTFLFGNNFPIISTACTSFGTFYVTVRGNIYSSGLNFHRKPATTLHDYSLSVPALKNNVKMVSAGASHACLLTMDGQVYSVGDGYFGLGHGNCDYLTTFKRVAGVEDLEFVHVSCGQAHTLLLTKCGRVLGFGASTMGQLSLVQKRVTSPVQITTDKCNRMIYCDAGYDFSFMIDETNTAYFMGNNGEKQGGFISNQKIVVEPTRITQLENQVKYISAGYANTAFLTLKNEIYTCGAALRGLLMRENTDIVLAKIDTTCFGQVPIRNVFYNTLIINAFIITDKTDVYALGDLSLLESSDSVLKLKRLFSSDSEVKIATGARHVIMYAQPRTKRDTRVDITTKLHNCHQRSLFCDIILSTITV